MLNVNQVATRYSKTPYQVTYAISMGLLKAEKWGGIWVMQEADLPKQWPAKGKGRPKKRSD